MGLVPMLSDTQSIACTFLVAAYRLCLCTVHLFECEAKKQGFGTKQSIFYVTVRSRSESRAWPIFGAPWRQCFCSMHWKPWLLLFITTSQSLQCIRTLSWTVNSTLMQIVSGAAGIWSRVPAVSLSAHAASWLSCYVGCFDVSVKAVWLHSTLVPFGLLTKKIQEKLWMWLNPNLTHMHIKHLSVFVTWPPDCFLC